MKPAAVVDSAIRVARADVGDELLARLRAALAYPNPNAGRWGEPATLSTVRLEGGDVVLPRGASALARDLGLRLIDRRLALPPRPFRLRRELRDYQAAARDAALEREQGVIVLPTGGGKTLTGLAIIAAAGQPALVVVPSLDLAEQWADAVRGDLGIEPSMCIAGAVNVGDVTIAHPRTLAGEGRLEELRERFGLVLIDEAHHAPAATTRAILDALPARYRFGITATPTRTDELAPLVAHYLGPVIARRSAAELAGRGFLIRPRREEVRTRFAFAYGGPSDWNPLLEALALDVERNELVADLIARECRGGIVGLALTSRVAHAAALVALLRARGVRAEGVTGEMPKAARSTALEAARRGELDALVATSLADEGLDVPRLSRLFLTWPARSELRLAQRIGRVLRPHEGKLAPVVFDVIDPRVGVLDYQAKKRARAFRDAWGSMREAA